MSVDITVFIPTRGRIGLEKQVTLRELREFSSVKPVLVCPELEVASHKALYGNFCTDVVACPATNINQTHEWMIRNCPTRGFVSLDDDQYFSYRPDPWAPRPLERIKDLDPMFEWISAQLDDGFAHGGISARQGNQNIPRPFTDCIRVNNAHFFDRDVFLHENITLPGENTVMHDFFFTLMLLFKGYPNRCGYQWCWSQRGSGAKGGCSIYRTQELQTKWCENLHDIFPGYVKLVTKENLSGGSVFSGERTDVNISWLKAWADRESSFLDRDNHLPDYTPGTPDLRRR